MTDLKSKHVLIADWGLFAEWAAVLARSFGRVSYFVPWASAYPRAAAAYVGEGLPGVTRVATFWDHVADADLVAFPDVYFAAWQDVVRAMGKPVFGHGHAENLELDRRGTRRLQRDLGIPAPPTRFFVGVDELAAYLRHVENKWVKISCYRGDAETWHHQTWHATETYLHYFRNRVGALADEYEFVVEDHIDGVEVGFDGWTAWGQWPEACYWGLEVKDEAYVGRFDRYDDLPLGIRTINTKMAPILRQEQASGFCSFEFRQDREGTAFLIDPCFSEDTEVLTDRGWRFFEALDGTESVATLDTATRQIVYQRPTDYIRHHYDGDMVQITTPKGVIDALVTPNHGVWRTDRHNHRLFVERADSLTDKGFIPRWGRWLGVQQDTFILPVYEHSWVSGRGRGVRKTKRCEELPVPMEDWLRFLALYLAEGSSHGRWGVNVSQRKHVSPVGDALKRLPFNVTRSAGGFVVHSVQLATHLRQFGLCDAKFVPDYVKTLTPKQIQVFLDSYLLGDGSVHKNGGQRAYSTTSRRMADDLQELVFKAGGVASIKVHPSAGTEMVSPRDGRRYVRNHDTYIVYERASWKDCWFETGGRAGQYLRRVPYHGFVYDVTVPNHTLYVRRKGKPFWSSNCLRCGSPPTEGTQEGYANLAEIVWAAAHGEMVAARPLRRYVAMAMIHAPFALTNWVPIDVPAEDRRWLKLRNVAVLGGKLYHVPVQGEMPEIGAVVGVADDLEEALDLVRDRAGRVRGYNLDIHTAALDKAQEEIARAAEYGIHFATD